ncbi:Outer membrane protein transport protein (OMPP1/FadL/TodX) [Roseovarius albus]|uniref:Outer membrane protein transport protein (OMPP1/FadL/TodX) n=1 Tax=Roseovarius albus TaxID=1247867 RepID=A0A1X6YZH9_9RHOB|nr:outer membrane protein transport protein [Roseovarius albus]SLN35942.1 Outer membrane protein transport protein (OMPP1/FadL/TodX) [Roseovarius albus]
MKYQGLVTATFASVTIAGMAHAAGIERAGDRSQILFEEGKNYLEFSATVVSPYISGTPNAGAPPALPVIGPGGFPIGVAPTAGTGNITERYITGAAGFKHQLNDQVAIAFTIDEPVGADVNYRAPNAVFTGSEAQVDSVAYTAMAKYKVNDNVSVYGGLRLQSLKGDVTVIAASGFVPAGGFSYTLNVDNDYKLGYLLGAAYEKPEIAMRVALTYESAITHDFRDNNGTEFDVEIPQAVTLHAQTGVAPDTLLFGSIKWREWTKFNIAPPDFVAQTGNPIAFEPDDSWTYELGLGHRFNDIWSGAVLLGYETEHDATVGNLQGKDGYISYGLAATYETESWEITTGVKYFDVGDAETSVSSFSGNDAIAFGMKLGFRF